MNVFAALDVSQDLTAICVVDGAGAVLAEAKVQTCPEAIAEWLSRHAGEVERVGMETGPLAVWLWNALTERGLPVVCLDARHANGVLKMMPNSETEDAPVRGTGAPSNGQVGRPGPRADRPDGLVPGGADQEPRRLCEPCPADGTGHAGRHARQARKRGPRAPENRSRVMFGKRVGGFKRRAEEIIARDLAVSPELVPVFEALMRARRDVLARIADLDRRIRVIARSHQTVRLLMTTPGVGPITAMAVVAAFDDAGRFRRSSSAGAYLGLTPRRYESGEISRNGRVSKRGDAFARKCLFEAANAIYCRKLGGSRLRDWAKGIAERTGPRKAKVALARKLAVTLHAMWRTGTPFREEVAA